jgi:acyl carrier protein
MDETIRQVLAEYGRLAVDVGSIDENADLFGAGMTSHASVNVMLALEDAFDIRINSGHPCRRTRDDWRVSRP